MFRLSFALLLLAAASARAEQPNILLIMADDLGYHDVGFHGSEHIRTPHLDALAASGVRFTDAHVAASVCSPSRAGLMTGRYQQRFGHEANKPPRGQGMDVDERTLGQALQDAGYRTAVIGKWHLGDEPEHYPNVRGFDEFWGLRGGSRGFWYNAEREAHLEDNPHAIEHNGTPVPFEGHLTDRFGDRAIAYIEAQSDQPFFLFLSFTAPHAPLQSKPEDMEALGLDDNYAGLVYGMDRNIGRVMEALKATGQLENTVIWFLSDNGGTTRAASNYPLAAIKGTKFEGGHRVPFVLSWKGQLDAGQVYDPMISALDIYPTCVALAGGSLEQERPLDGVNLIPFLKGERNGIPHEQLYWRKLECAAMRDGDWKLIRVAGLEDHLFNLATDIGEHHDLAQAYPERLARMQQMLRDWESDKIEPLWEEEDRWVGIRRADHQSWYKHGKLPRDMGIPKPKGASRRNAENTADESDEAGE